MSDIVIMSRNNCLMCDGYGYVCAMGRHTCPDCGGTGERTENQRNFVRNVNALRGVRIAETYFAVSNDRVEVRGE